MRDIRGQETLLLQEDSATLYKLNLNELDEFNGEIVISITTLFAFGRIVARFSFLIIIDVEDVEVNQYDVICAELLFKNIFHQSDSNCAIVFHINEYV